MLFFSGKTVFSAHIIKRNIIEQKKYQKLTPNK